MTDFYQFRAKSLQGGREVPMSEYAGKVVLVVNTASQCGFTPQLEGLQKLYEKYAGQGLVVLGFPCNQFGRQEPGDEASIAGGCVLNYGVTFPMFAKVKVNGQDAHPLFIFLKSKLRGIIFRHIKWNFTKFLVARDGKPLKRFSPMTTPASIEAYLLKNNLMK